MDRKKRIGKKIKKYRMEKRLTQKQLGELLNYSDGSIQSYESGRSVPKDDLIIKFAEILNSNELLIEIDKFPVLNTDKYSTQNEYVKLVEEVDEFIQAWERGNLVEEFYDVIQVLVNIMDKKGITEEQLKNGLIEHKTKMLNRGWGIKRWI